MSRDVGKATVAMLYLALVSATGCASSHVIDGLGGRPGVDDPSDDPGSAPASQAQPLSYYRDAKPILDQRCALCHHEAGIGPLPFTRYDEVQPYLALIKADITRGVMPPWRAAGPRDVYEGDRRLTEEQKATLLRWIDEGGERGDPEQEPEPLPVTERGLPRVDETLRLPSAFTPEQEPDSYRCFVFEWPHEERTFITGLSVEPGEPTMVHHAIVYLVSPESAAGMRERDAAEPGEGFDCFSSTSLGAWLTSYEPGGYGQQFPGGIGMQIEPSSVIVLQIHYNTLKGKRADRTRVDLMLDSKVERVGTTTLLLNPLWVVPQLNAMHIPKNEPDVVHRWQGAPFGLSPPQDIFAVDLHMHTLGRSGSIGIVRQDGAVEVLLDIPDWAFEWQETYRFNRPVRLQAGDQLFVECHFDNTADHQLVIGGKQLEPRDVAWGEGTTDEMCLGNVLTTPVR